MVGGGLGYNRVGMGRYLGFVHTNTSMIRTGLFSTRAFTVAAATALSVAPVYAQEKPSVYPEADSPVTAIETTTELERQVSQARAFVQTHTRDFLRTARSGVDSAIAVENHVECA